VVQGRLKSSMLNHLKACR